jgi:hypothetical protein
MRADPMLAWMVNTGVHEHCVPGTVSSYNTGARDYIRFCEARGLDPWPVDEVTYCGWLHVTAARIKMSSLGMYMAGVRNSSILFRHEWDMAGNEMVRRSMRYLKRKYPAMAKGSKVPITVGVLARILPLLAGWPDMARMSEDDRVFASASVSAVSGFLRGGEFLAVKKSSRPVLLASNVSIRLVGTRKAQVIEIPQPKTRWWTVSQSVPCFANNGDEDLCPVRLWHEYSTRCPSFKPDGPAFMLRGKALSRDLMVSRTVTLMRLANISFVDHKGVSMDVRAASCPGAMELQGMGELFIACPPRHARVSHFDVG